MAAICLSLNVLMDMPFCKSVTIQFFNIKPRPIDNTIVEMNYGA